jgi:hypothetical protein
MSRYRSSLASMQAPQMDAEAVKRTGWAEQQILVVALNDARLDWVRREQVRQLGEYLYGRKHNDAK